MRLLPILIISAVLTAVVGAVPVLSNNSFETPAMPAWVSGSYVYNPAGAGWTFSGGSGIAADGSDFNVGELPGGAPDGTQVGFLQQTGTISQTVSGLIPFWSYTVTFYAAGRPFHGNYGGDQGIDVTVNGNSIGTFLVGSGSPFVQKSATFTATGAAATLQFAGTLAAGDQTAFIDLVTLDGRAPAVPEPATFGLIGLGGALIAAGRFRRS